MAWRADGRHLQKAPLEAAVASGNRIASMEAMHQMASSMRCTGCKKYGTFVVSAAHEHVTGLRSEVGLYCGGACRKVTAAVPLSDVAAENLPS